MCEEVLALRCKHPACVHYFPHAPRDVMGEEEYHKCTTKMYCYDAERQVQCKLILEN